MSEVIDPLKLRDEMSWLREGLQESEAKRKEAADIYAKTQKQLQEKIADLEDDLGRSNENQRQLRALMADREKHIMYLNNKLELAPEPDGDGPLTIELVPCTADAILDRAAGHMRDRAATYDAPGGERSMGKVAAIARVLYADQLARGEYTEEMAWGLQVVLKLVRSSQGAYRADNYEDMAAYSALMGESAGREARRDG